jgi:hypothetical protein
MLGNIARYLLRTSALAQALDAADQAETYAINRIDLALLPALIRS